ncbi:hypothetical protein LCGC14_2602200 [marine sediment metagenome]|uniref:Uncharacterized protein n=1 Tax=marine sediment metagenome TaxID=412755 RepID=A0A0F9A8N3_9ZZZZ
MTNTKATDFTMGWAAIFMIAWTVLLLWASIKPVEDGSQTKIEYEFAWAYYRETVTTIKSVFQ